MRGFLRHRPSGAMLVAVLALILAASGTAIAASNLVKGDKLIKKRSLSGNRLRNHTITGKQVNLKRLGKVPNARQADNATNATHATTADNATKATLAASAINAINATNATNATRAGSSAATDDIKTWSGTASQGHTVTLLTIGPFTITGACTTVTGQPDAQTQVATSQANSALDSFASGSKTPFGPSDGPQPIGPEAGGGGTPPQWAGPSGSDAVLSGDGHTYANTFASTGTGLNGHDCTFVGSAITFGS
jgi:hypothetical protein